MPIIAGKRCKHCGGRLVEEVTYPEGDREERCILCTRVDPEIPNFIKRELASGKWGKRK